MSKPPTQYTQFVERFPELGRAWEAIGTAGAEGPLDAKVCRLIKLGIAIGAQKEGPAHASVRKGVQMGLSREEMEQVVCLAAGTVGMPASVAAWCWIRDVFESN